MFRAVPTQDGQKAYTASTLQALLKRLNKLYSSKGTRWILWENSTEIGEIESTLMGLQCYFQW